MNFYLKLHVKLLNRQLVDFGLHPLLFYLVAATSFIGFSNLFFSRIDSAQYWYVCIPLFLMGRGGQKQRRDFLKSIHTKNLFYKLRVIEGLLISVPFALVLLYHEAYEAAVTLLLFSTIFSLFRFERRLNFVIPTPFGRHPFEFTIGFRKTYLIIIISYAISIIGLIVGNFYLALFGSALLFLNCSSFYLKPEPPYFVWLFSTTPEKFIRAKTQAALIFTLLLSMPLMILLSVFNVENIHLVLFVHLLGLLLVIASLLGKYAQYPSELNLIQGISLGVSIVFPPLFFIIIPIFYFKSIKRLSLILT